MAAHLIPPLRGPDVCPKGHHKTHVVKRWRGRWHLARRHECHVCPRCRWTSYQTLINPRTVHAEFLGD